MRAIAGLVGAGLLVLAPAAPAPAAPPTPVPTPTPTQTPVSVPGPVVGGERLGREGVQRDLAPGVPAPRAPRATAWLVADLDSRQVLVASRAHRPLAPASTLKIFTALALAPALDPGTVYTAVDADAAVDGTKVGLAPGSRYTVDDLLHGLLMSSGNDCAHAIGRLSGGQAAAVARIQSQAQELGALDTVVRNTSGLDAPGQVSSAYDLALAGSAALAEPRLARLMRTTAYPFPGRGHRIGHGRKHFQIQNHNRLLRLVPGATGVKNGYTRAARASLVGSATHRGHRYLVVVLRSAGSIWTAAADLLQWAFRYGDRAAPVGVLVGPGDVPPAIPAPTASPAPVAGHLVPGRASSGRAASGGSIRDGVLPAAGIAALTAGALVAGASGRAARRRRRP